MDTKLTRILWNALTIALIFSMLIAPIAQAAVWTDQEDYAPGSVVTISGDKSVMQNGQQPYVDGSQVSVTVNGPNGWSSACSATVENGAWSCQVTLSSDPAVAVGPYEYTASSTAADGSPIVESGSFTDGNATITGKVTDSGGSPIAGATVTCTSDCNQADSTSTDADGSYILKVQFSGSSHSITLTASKTGYTSASLTFYASGNISGKDFTLTLSPSCTAPTLSAHPTNATKTVGDSATFSVTASGTTPLSYQWRKGGSAISGATNSSFTINSVVVADAGSYDVVVSNSCGSVTSNAATLTVSKAATTTIVTCGAGPFTYTGSAQTPCTAKVTGSGGFEQALAVTYINNTNAGTATASASFAENENYLASSGSAQFTIGKADAACSISGYSGTYDAASHGASGTCVGIGGENAGTLNLGATFKDVPGGTAHWAFTGNGNYKDQSGSVAIVISKADATCAISGYTGVYDAAYHGASGSCSGIGGENAGTLDLGDTFKDVPGGTANWTFTGNGNYKDQSGSAAIVISKADADCSISGYTGVYDAAYHGASGSCSGIGGENAGTLDLGATFKDVPGGTAHWAFTGNGNYNDQSGDVAIVISKADATCNISGYTGVYDAAYHGASGSCSGIGGESAGTLDLGATFKDVPGGTAHWAFTGNVNYKDQSGDVAIVISKADATCAISGYSGVYDAAYHGAIGTCVGIGGESAGTLDLGDTFKNVPGGTAHWTFTGNGNYNDQSGDVAIVISKADATCAISGYTGVYDAAYHGASGSCSGIGGESAGTLNLGATFKDVPGGTAHWAFTGNGNYNDQSGDVEIVISKADATCNISGYSGVYDAAYHGASGSCSGIGGESAGTLDLGATFKDVPGGTAHWAFTGNVNYNDQSGSVAIVISKAQLTVTADNQSIIFGQTLPAFTFKYSGFVDSEDASVVDTPPTCGVGAIPMYGSYPIVCSGGADNNYDFKYVNGTLTVQAWTLRGFYQPVDMNNVLNVVKNGSTVPLKFEIFAGDTELTEVSAVKSLMYGSTNCSSTAVTDEIETVATGGTVLRYDSTGGQFIYNWKTPNTAGKCYRVTMTTLDGSTLQAYFKLK